MNFKKPPRPLIKPSELVGGQFYVRVIPTVNADGTSRVNSTFYKYLKRIKAHKGEWVANRILVIPAGKSGDSCQRSPQPYYVSDFLGSAGLFLAWKTGRVDRLPNSVALTFKANAETLKFLNFSGTGVDFLSLCLGRQVSPGELSLMIEDARFWLSTEDDL